MTRFERIRLNPVTDADGDAVVYSPVISGRIVSVTYTKDTTAPFADGVDLNLVGNDTGLVVWSEDDVNAGKAVYPLAAAVSTAGAALEYATGFAQGVPVAIAGERLKLTIGAGGASKTGTFDIVIEGVCLS